MILAVVLTLAIGVVAAGCGDDVDRDDYVAKNLALLRSVPSFPGARHVQVESSGYKRNEQDGATAGYGTIREYSIPSGTRPAEVMTFYRHALRRDWRVADVSAAPSLSLRKGDAYLHILAGDGRVALEVDHDCFKGGSSPVCFGP